MMSLLKIILMKLLSQIPNQEKEEPPQDSDIRQLIREECCVEVSEEQKQSLEDTMLELVKICQEKEFLCIHDNIDDVIESALNTKLLSINSQHLKKEQQEIKNIIEQPTERENRSIQSLQNFKVVHKNSISLNTSQTSSIHAIAPILSTKEPEHSLSMGYEHLSITHETKSNEVTESNAKNLLPIPSECEVTLEDKRKCDVPISQNSPVCVYHYDIFSDSTIDDDISVYDDDFKDIEYVEASLSNPEIISVEEEHVVHQAENDVNPEKEEVDLEDISQIQDVVLHEKLLSITCLISNIEYLNDNPTPDHVLKSFEFDNSLLDNFSPEFENFCDHSEETRSEGNIRFLEELLIDNSILSHEASDSNFEDNPSIPRPPSELPDAETDAGKEIPVAMNNKDKFDEDYYFFMFDKVFSFLSTKGEDTIFDPEPPDDNFDLEPEVISAVMEDIDEPDEHFNPGREINVSTKIEDDDYFPCMFVIRFFLPYFIFPEISPLLLSAERYPVHLHLTQTAPHLHPDLPMCQGLNPSWHNSPLSLDVLNSHGSTRNTPKWNFWPNSSVKKAQPVLS
nr:hypothetical protein [Tanacetum cinerariifolium]